MLMRRNPGFFHHRTFELREVIRRAFWAAMLLLHVGPIVSAWAGLGGSPDVLSASLRFLFLGGSAAFFVLKIADVSWLRLRPGWRTAVTSLVVIALLHVNVLDRTAGTRIAYSPGHVGVVLFIGGLLGAEKIAGGLARLMRFPSVPPRIPPAPIHQRAMHVAGFGPAQWVLAHRICPPRAPPAC